DGAEAAVAHKATAQTGDMSLDALNRVGGDAALEARAVDANDSDAVARAKKALDALDIQEGLDELEGEGARVHVGDKQMI
ncbi:hypothetical protein, partial [Mycobacterium tuberculosis]